MSVITARRKIVGKTESTLSNLKITLKANYGANTTAKITLTDKNTGEPVWIPAEKRMILYSFRAVSNETIEGNPFNTCGVTTVSFPKRTRRIGEYTTESIPYSSPGNFKEVWYILVDETLLPCEEV